MLNLKGTLDCVMAKTAFGFGLVCVDLNCIIALTRHNCYLVALLFFYFSYV